MRCWGEFADPPPKIQRIGLAALDLGHERARGILAFGTVFRWHPSPTTLPDRLSPD